MTARRTGSTASEVWHWTAWLCEFAGTGLMLIAGLSAVFLDFGPESPLNGHVSSTSVRLLVTGILFAGGGSLVAVSPLGRLSGAHLNPAVTVAFWTQGKVPARDLIGYVVAQCAGAIAACLVLRWLWRTTATRLHLGATQPGSGVSVLLALLIEVGMTATLVLAIFFMTSSPRTTRWTPLATWLLVAVLVWRGAPYTGTSLNPARSLAPALLAPLMNDLWLYLAGPIIGAALAAAVFAAFRQRQTLTAKLFHDQRYPSPLHSDLPTTNR